MKKIDGSCTNEFYDGLYIELIGSLDKTIYCKYLLDCLNVYKMVNFQNQIMIHLKQISLQIYKML